MISVLTAGICLLLVAVGVVRIRNGSAQSTPTYWAYTQVCLLVGLAKLARTPVITDDVINPALKTVTGLANVMTFVGMSLAACATVPAVVLMLALTGRPVAYRPWFIAQAAIAGAMFVAYVISPIADIPSSYITTDIPFSWSVWMYWGVFLGSVGLAGALNAALAVQAVRVVRSGPFALTLVGWATTAGLACIYTVNKIVDPATGNEIDIPAEGLSEPGELWVAGPNVMAGYLNNDKATKETIDDDGFLHTGDMARVDANGCVYIVDRLKELIKYKGYQVPPAELEALLLTHDDVADVAVIGVIEADTGEEIPKAFVVKREGSELTEQQVIDFVAGQVAPHKKVREVEFIDAIPKSAAGKILRKDLRKPA